MARVGRAIIGGVPYHVTQRGNRRQDVFFTDDHRRRYLGWLRHYSESHNLQIVAYCLMTNHIHLVVVPHEDDSLARTLQVVHTLHSQSINAEYGWTGHLWQGRYYSTPLDEPHLWASVRYVEMNPVRSGDVVQAWEYPWSSAGHHLGLKHEGLLSKTMWTVPVSEWRELLTVPQEDEVLQTIRTRTTSGYPCGDDAFVARIGDALGRDLTRRSVGRPRKEG